MSETPMHIPMPIRENKINWNTLISLGGFIIMIGGFVWAGGAFTARSTALEATVLENAIELREKQKALETRTAVLESENRKLDNLQYRLSVVEQNNADTFRNLSELVKSQNDLSSDMKVVREILSRLDQNRNP